MSLSGFDAADCDKKMFEGFGPGSPYADNSQLTAKYSKNMKDKSMYPINGKWQGFNLRRFTNLYSKGKCLEDESEEDTNVDPENIIRSVPLVAMYAGDPDMLSTVHNASSQLQTSDLILTIVLASCRIMEQYIVTNDDGSNPKEDFCPQVDKVIEDLKSSSRIYPNSLDRAVAGFLKEVVDCRQLSVDEATKKFGVA